MIRHKRAIGRIYRIGQRRKIESKKALFTGLFDGISIPILEFSGGPVD